MSQQTIDSFINTPYRSFLAEEVTRKAVIYNNLFKQLAIYTDQHLEEPGVMAAVITAVQSIQNQKIFNFFVDPRIDQLALQTARAQIELNEAGKMLMADGVPSEVYFELSRRVTDQDLPESSPIYVTNIEDEE